MKMPAKRKPKRELHAAGEMRNGILIRPCHGIPEFEACVQVERSVWQSSDLDVVPIPLFVVAAETGGQVLGAFHENKMVGFTMAIAGWRDRRPFLHSHMTAVLSAYWDRGIGRRLKRFQREDALARGIQRVEWTFDPLMTKNAYFNFMRLGAIARRYLPNAYGITTSPLHAGLPTDRLVAEWHLRSPRVIRVLAGKRPTPAFSSRAVRITIPSSLADMKGSDPDAAARLQAGLRTQFQTWFGKGYIATAVAPVNSGVDYILEPGKSL
jgi:predicted GNAT superfamily acetyltransferase